MCILGRDGLKLHWKLWRPYMLYVRLLQGLRITFLSHIKYILHFGLVKATDQVRLVSLYPNSNTFGFLKIHKFKSKSKTLSKSIKFWIESYLFQLSKD